MMISSRTSLSATLLQRLGPFRPAQYSTNRTACDFPAQQAPWGSAAMRGLFTILAGMGLACVLAAAASTAEPRHVFHVTLNATVTKLWSATTRATRDGCPTSTRFQGRDSVMFRSSRPTTIVVTFGGGRVTYTPRAVRSLDLVVDHRGTRTVTTAGNARSAAGPPHSRAAARTRSRSRTRRCRSPRAHALVKPHRCARSGRICT